MSIVPEIQVTVEMLDRARAGEAAAHSELYAGLSRPVYTLLRRLVAHSAVAEDLMQDVFVEILRNLDSYDSSGSFAGWVRSIAVNKALMHLRSPWYRRLLPIDAERLLEPASEADHASASNDELERALNLLTPTSRSVVWLHDVEGYTHQEIARLFGRTASFSKSQLARAHGQLRATLQSQPGEFACTPLSRN